MKHHLAHPQPLYDMIAKGTPEDARELRNSISSDDVTLISALISIAKHQGSRQADGLAAIEILASMRVDAVLPLVISAIEGADLTLKLHLIDDLGMLRDPVTLPIMISLAADGQVDEQRRLEQQLADDHWPKAQRLDALMPLLGETDLNAFTAVACALASTGDSRVLKPLLSRVPIWPTGRSAAEALSNFPDPRGQQALSSLFASPDAMQRFIASGPFASKGWESTSYDDMADPRYAFSFIAWIKDPDERVRWNGMAACASLRLIAAKPILMLALTAGKVNDRCNAVRALTAYLPDPEITQAMIASQSDAEPIVRASLFEEGIWLGRPDEEDLLCHGLQDSAVYVRSAVLMALWKFAAEVKPRVLSAVMKAVDDPDSGVSSMAGMILRQAGMKVPSRHVNAPITLPLGATHDAATASF